MRWKTPRCDTCNRKIYSARRLARSKLLRDANFNCGCQNETRSVSAVQLAEPAVATIAPKTESEAQSVSHLNTEEERSTPDDAQQFISASRKRTLDEIRSRVFTEEGEH